MADQLHPPHDPPRFDDTRVNTRGIFWFVVWFTLAGVVILPSLWWLQRVYLRHPYIPPAPIAEPLDLPQPLQPSPTHPSLPWQDMTALRDAQAARLHSYGATETKTHAHIPIDRAIDLLLQSGQLQQPWTNPTTQPYQLESPPAPYAKPPVENRT